MTEKTERVWIKFCQKVGKTCKEAYDMIKMAFREDSVSLTQGFEWFHSFEEG
jgi:hypothetical protein